MYITDEQSNKEIQTNILEEKQTQKRKSMTLQRAERVPSSDEINFVHARNTFRPSVKQRFCFRESASRMNKYTFLSPFIQKSCIFIHYFCVNKTYFPVFSKKAGKQNKVFCDTLPE